MPNPRRVALVDDHKLVRAGLKSLINNLPDYQVDQEGADGTDAVAIAHSGNTDILVLDVSMPGLGGIEALTRIRSDGHQLPVLMLSMYDSPDFVVRALRQGADGYILKDAAEDELQLALNYATRKQPFLSPGVTRHVIDMAAQPGPEASVRTGLTRRQTEVMECIARGLGTRDIAASLGVSVKTVEAHRSQIIQRLGLSSSAELGRYAVQHFSQRPLTPAPPQ